MAGFIYPEHNLKSFTDFELVRFLLLKKKKKEKLPIFHKQA